MKTVSVIRHIKFEDLGNFHDVLKEKNYDINYIDACTATAEEISDLDPDLLIILGGPISVNDVKDFPWLLNEINLIKTRIKLKLPTIGICLGAQLIAKACGSKVYSGPKKEIGWSALDIVGSGNTHPIHHLKEVPVLHWHGETFDLPQAASLIASTADYANQAFTIGNYCLGLQFHPEAKPENLDLWYSGHILEISLTPGLSVSTLRDEEKKYAVKLQPYARKFWLEVLEYMNCTKESKICHLSS